MHAQSLLGPERTIPPSALYLGLAGVLPFWLAALLFWSHADPVGTSTAAALAIAYGAVILAFLGGVRWGLAIATPGRAPAAATLVLSVLPALAGFAAMFTPPLFALAVLVSGFLLQALWDVIAADHGRLPQWFAMLRMILTALVVPALLLLIAKLGLTALA